VASLVELEVDLEDLETTLNLDAAFEALNSTRQSESMADAPSVPESQIRAQDKELARWDPDSFVDDDDG
jgi:hypothetical protein